MNFIPAAPDPQPLPGIAARQPDPTSAPKLTFPAPVATPEVKPLAVSQSAPKTSYDVDLHAVKANDSYASICREHYNDAKYDLALKQFNGGRALPNSGTIDIPPIHVLRKMYPGSITNTTGRTTSGAAAEWVAPSGAAASTPAATEFRPSKSGSYTVRNRGETLKTISRTAFGTDQRWRDLYDLNREVNSPDDVLPAGTVVKLPPDAQNP